MSRQLLAAESLNREISKALQGTRMVLDLKYQEASKQYRTAVVIQAENINQQDILNLCSRFFSACYGYSEHPVEIATITFRNDQGDRILAMGIGYRKARSLPAITWIQFSDRGHALQSWVLEHTNTNPASPGDVCYLKSNL